MPELQEHHQLFSDKSDLYESARPTYPDSIYRFLSEQCHDTTRAWDCACGNGQAAIDLANYFNRIEATDVSEQQISHAKPHPRIHYQVAHAEQTPFADDSFDLITVAQALHWFDFPRFWHEVQRVLKTGGVFAAWGYIWPDWGADLEPIIQSQVLDIIDPYFAPHNRLLWNHYRDIEFPFEAIDIPEINMQAELNLDQLFAFLHTASATRRCMQDQGDEFFKQAYKNAASAWGDTEQHRTFSFDFVFYAGRFV